MQLRVRVLGEFEVGGTEGRLPGSRKARTLLKALALARGKPVSVDALVEWLWPEGPPRRPEEQVVVLVSRLRTVLGVERVVRSDAGYKLLVDWLDLDALYALAAEASQHLATGLVAEAGASAGAALALARGPVVADEPDAEWVRAERLAVERLIAGVRHTAARAALLRSDFASAAELAAGALEGDPYDEVALRLLMRAHAEGGRPASALAAYARMRERLDDDLGTDPAPATDALHLAILRGEPLPDEAEEGGIAAGQALGGETPNTALPGQRAAGRSGSSILPGRAIELATLDAALRRVAAGGPVEVIVVEGEAGIGKSRLLNVWRERAAAAGATLLLGPGDEMQRNLPLQPLLAALDGHLRTLPGPDAVRRALGAEHALLAPLLPASPPTDRPLAPDPAAGQAMLFTALRAVLARLAAQGPVVVLLDDLHLADRSTVEWLHFLVGHGGAPGLLVVGAQRPEEAQPLPTVQRIPIGPLDLAATAVVVGAARAPELHTRSKGHPLFLVELAASEEVTLPASVREAIDARCERASPQVAATLRAAALLGPTIELDVLAAVTQTPPLDILVHLEEGVRRRLLEAAGDSFAFRHDLVREALVASTSAMRRAFVHREAARLLAAQPRHEPLVVAHHARLGGDRELAAGALAEAARDAEARYDFAEAERLLDEAIDLADTTGQRLQRARTRTRRANFHGAEADALAALGAGAGAEALETAGWAAYLRRDVAAALRYAEDGARASTGNVRARCLALSGRVRYVTGNLEEANANLAEAMTLATAPLERVALAAWQGELRAHQGRAAEALDLVRPATRVLRAPEHQQVAMHAHLATVQALAILGRADEALSALTVWRDEVEAQQARHYAMAPDNYQAWVLRALGDPAEADELNERAREAAQQAGQTEPLAHALLDLASGRLRAGETSAAAAYLELARPLAQQLLAYRWRLESRAQLLHGYLALARGRPEEARRLTMGLLAESRAKHVRRYVDLSFLLAVRAAAALEEPVDLDATSEALDRLATSAGLEAWWVAAEVAAATGVPAFWALAERHAGHLVSHAGARAAAFQRYAAAHLGRVRSGLTSL